VLQDLDELLVRYESLRTSAWRNLDGVGYGMQDVNGIRLRLILNVTILDAFNNAYALFHIFLQYIICSTLCRRRG